jgi:hypothetical protein
MTMLMLAPRSVVMISRLQLNLRSDTITSPQIYTSQLPTLPSPVDLKGRQERFDSNGTSTAISSLSHFFASTVSELGKDVEFLGGERCAESVQKAVPMRAVEVESEIEMTPIRPVSGGAYSFVQSRGV